VKGLARCAIEISEELEFQLVNYSVAMTCTAWESVILRMEKPALRESARTGQPPLEFVQRLGSVAQTILDFLTKLAKGLIVTLRNKKRVIAESASPARGQRDPPLAHAYEKLRLQLGLVGVAHGRRGFRSRLTYRRQGQDAAKARDALIRRNFLEQAQELGVVVIRRRVALTFSRSETG
jgi:hypothetical protein